MLDLLSVYGQEYPETFYGDSTGILDLGTLVHLIASIKRGWQDSMA